MFAVLSDKRATGSKNMWCAVYSVQFVVLYVQVQVQVHVHVQVQCVVCSVQFAVCRVKCPFCIVQCAAW